MPRLFREPSSIPGLTWPALTFGDRLAIDLGGDAGALPPCVSISQTRTEQILDEALAGQPLGHVTGLEQGEGGVTVRCGDRVLHASYAMVCAGARGGGRSG